MLIMWWIAGRITVGSFDNNKITFRNRLLQLGGDFFMSKIINKERMIEMKKEEKYYQIYRIHLRNGEVIEASEEYDLPVEKGLVGKFQKADDNKIFEIGDAVSGVFYIPKRSILFIATGEVKKGWC